MKIYTAKDIREIDLKEAYRVRLEPVLEYLTNNIKLSHLDGAVKYHVQPESHYFSNDGVQHFLHRVQEDNKEGRELVKSLEGLGYICEWIKGSYEYTTGLFFTEVHTVKTNRLQVTWSK